MPGNVPLVKGSRMGATIQYQPPRIVGTGNIKEPKPFVVLPTQNAAWRAGDILVQSTTGTITNPPAVGSGSLASALAPGATGASAITLGTSASAGAPALTYYGVATYTGTSAESATSAPFIINCPAGFLPTVTVASAGAPGTATGFNTYLGLYPGQYFKQDASATSLASAFTATYPLANFLGANRGATNLSSNILGIAQTAVDATYFSGIGGAFTAGQNSSQLGSTNTVPPLMPSDAYQLYVTGLGYGQYVELNLNQNTMLTQGILGTTAGLTLDAASGIWTVDPTQSNKIVTIAEFRQGVAIGPTASGSFGDLGARVVVYFNSGLLLQ